MVLFRFFFFLWAFSLFILSALISVSCCFVKEREDWFVELIGVNNVDSENELQCIKFSCNLNDFAI